MNAKEQAKQEAIKRLREVLKPGDVVHTVLRHVSRSGMSREIAVKAIKDNEVIGITGWAAEALGRKLGDRDGVRVGGCGMDMGFWLVYSLSRVLFPEGFICIGKKRRCPSNDHTNRDGNFRPHRHKDGGYALIHRWL